MNVDCPICKLLWDEFAEATKAHFAINGNIQIAQIQQNSAVLTRLEPTEVAAAERRSAGRLAFKEHEASHQNGTSHQSMKATGQL
jgi:hypothetical protein